MIDRKALLDDLKKLVGRLEEDLRGRAKEDSVTSGHLQQEYQAAKKAERTGDAYEMWVEDRITQAAVAWVLACVFVRFLEDNELLARPYLSGPGPRKQLALDHETAYFREHPHRSHREYLLDAFREIARLPAMEALLGEKRNPLWRLQLSADGADDLISFWRLVDPATGVLVHDFADPSWTTRYLGDLYQDLSEYARKRYALLQTPDFVVTFILDRTLEPAIAEFGYREVRLIDPTCGSGHFLLDAFHRLVKLWMRDEPGTNLRELAQRALNQVYGVDLSPTVVEIARFRLLVEALRFSGVKRLDQAPDLRTNLAVGDSLLHGPRPRYTDGRQLLAWREEDRLAHVYDVEDADDLKRILGQPYHVVVGNPPYITPKDPALREAYRRRYDSCSGKYSLGVPFTERFFDLAVASADGEPSPAGYVGMITANSFMKREFGKRLIERFLPEHDLTHVVDTSGAYVPGHTTSTVILFARNRRPVAPTIRTVRGIRGEPAPPAEPARGRVWIAIVDQVDRPGSTSEFVSADDVSRKTFGDHPWSIGGGGAAELRERLDAARDSILAKHVASVGPGCILGEDDAFSAPRSSPRARTIPSGLCRVAVDGDQVRDWSLSSDVLVLFPYSVQIELCAESLVRRWLWPLRAVLYARADFSKRTYRECGRPYWEFHQIPPDRNRTPLSIAFGEIATHNHFVLDRGGKVFNRTAPVIKLSPGANEDDHLALLGLLNSSTACFWLKQTVTCKGLGGQGGGIKPEDWHRAYVFSATRLLDFPVPPLRDKLVPVARELDDLARRLMCTLPRSVLEGPLPKTRKRLDEARAEAEQIVARMVLLQEELDWKVYALFGLCNGEVVAEIPAGGLRPEDRPAETLLQERIESGEVSIFYEVHRYRGVGPQHELSDATRALARQRIGLIRESPELALIETPNHKRRWQFEPWEEQERRALRSWLLARLEDRRYWPTSQITTCGKLADQLRHDLEFLQVAELYRGRPDHDLTELVVELVETEAVPFFAAFRYSDSGRMKRTLWERTWELQRREDAGDKVEIDAPPKYRQEDFQSAVYWRLRGKLDVPKERFILYPLAGRDSDPTHVIGLAGWDHLQQAKALASWIVERQQQDGWGGDRLLPLLAGLEELLPWLRQWHNEIDPDTAQRLGDYFTQWVDEEAHKIGATREDLRSYVPPAGVGRKRRTKKTRA